MSATIVFVFVKFDRLSHGCGTQSMIRTCAPNGIIMIVLILQPLAWLGSVQKIRHAKIAICVPPLPPIPSVTVYLDAPFNTYFDLFVHQASTRRESEY